MEHIFPGFTPPQLEGKVWWFPFHITPDVPEALAAGKERSIYHGSTAMRHLIQLH